MLHKYIDQDTLSHTEWTSSSLDCDMKLVG